jgi:hypothetical protein
VCIGDSLGLFSYPRRALDISHICVNIVPQRSSPPDESSFEEESSLLFCAPRIWAFSLKFKTWKMVSHHELVDVQPQDRSFAQDLCMKSSRKESLELIVSAYMRDGKLISSKEKVGRKGQGLNILLSGSSGTGKTLTVGKYIFIIGLLFEARFWPCF